MDCLAPENGENGIIVCILCCYFTITNWRFLHFCSYMVSTNKMHYAHKSDLAASELQMLVRTTTLLNGCLFTHTHRAVMEQHYQSLGVTFLSTWWIHSKIHPFLPVVLVSSFSRGGFVAISLQNAPQLQFTSYLVTVPVCNLEQVA